MLVGLFGATERVARARRDRGQLRVAKAGPARRHLHRLQRALGVSQCRVVFGHVRVHRYFFFAREVRLHGETLVYLQRLGRVAVLAQHAPDAHVRVGGCGTGHDRFLQARERLRLLVVDQELQTFDVGVVDALAALLAVVLAYDPARTDDQQRDGYTGEEGDYGSITHGIRRNLQLERQPGFDSVRVFERKAAECRDLAVHARELAAGLCELPAQRDLVHHRDQEREHHPRHEHEQHQDGQFEPGVELGEEREIDRLVRVLHAEPEEGDDADEYHK
jgi:hypothetical protein